LIEPLDGTKYLTMQDDWTTSGFSGRARYKIAPSPVDSEENLVTVSYWTPPSFSLHDYPGLVVADEDSNLFF
jgi:hypothetical protein